jgi:cysteine-rich repeat protein
MRYGDATPVRRPIRANATFAAPAAPLARADGAIAVVPALLPRLSMSTHRLVLLALPVMVVLAAAPAVAGPLVRAEPDGRAGALPSERALTVDDAAVASLRGRETATVEAFPLGADGAVTLDLVRARPFGPDTRIEEMTDAGPRPLPLPDETYFSGTVRGAVRSRVLLIASDDGVRGFVVRDGETYPFGRDGMGTHRVYAMRDLGPASAPAPSEFCGNDLHPDRMLSIPVPRAMAPRPTGLVGPNTILEVEVAIETDNELRNKFASANATASYLTALLAASNVIYEDDVKVRLAFTYVRIWSTTDPWTTGDTLGSLNQLQAHWLDPGNGMEAVAGPHDLVHFISGKDVSGGIAYIAAACDAQYHFGVSQVDGAFNVSQANGIWDVLVFTHELGHNLGSEHTHCYSPPVDHCYSGEEKQPGVFCYVGPESLPAGGGTIMSYCHMLPGGLGNVDLAFGDTVSDAIRDFVAGAACLEEAATCGNGDRESGEQCDDGDLDDGDGCSALCELEGPCGDGIVGAGEQCDDSGTTPGDGCDAACQLETTCGDGATEGVEQCDDGNTDSGDGCSYKCRLEGACGNAALDGLEQCDDGNTAGGDGCSAICRFEVCGNGFVDVTEQCDDGNPVSGDGCSDACVDEPLCGDASLDPGEACDDGNTASGDGCSAACEIEPCQILVPHQATWAPAKLVATPSTFTLRARFGVPADALDLAEVAAVGLRLLVDGASGARAVDLAVPGGGGWILAGKKLRYHDPAGSAGGVRSIVIRAKGDAVATVDLKVLAKKGVGPDGNDAPPTVTVLLGDESAGDVGACGRHAFGGSCRLKGKKLSCK